MNTSNPKLILKSTVDSGKCDFIGMMARGFYKDVEFHWDLVQYDAVKKFWLTFDEESEMKSIHTVQHCLQPERNISLGFN